MIQDIDEGFKFDLREMLDIAVDAKRAYWDANRDVELMFCDENGNMSAKVESLIEDTIKTLASTSNSVGPDEVEYLLKRLEPYLGGQS